MNSKDVVPFLRAFRILLRSPAVQSSIPDKNKSMEALTSTRKEMENIFTQERLLISLQKLYKMLAVLI